ncbi:MAG: hypothetical protein ACKVU2_18565 [Saprospiraceae bacterium]
MLKQTLTLGIALLLALSATAQKKEKLYARFGVNVGASVLFHNTLMKTTSLGNLYEVVKESHKPPESYTWEQFEQDYELTKSYTMPRYGFNLFVMHQEFPVFLNLDLASSPSSYQKLMFAATLGIGKDYRPFERDYFFSGHIGFKRVFCDAGFGYETLTNSVGNDYARENLATFFKPDEPLGSQSGYLLSTRLGFGHVIGQAERAAIGVELYHELDLTNETARQGGARMTNLGINLYLRFDLKQTSF